MVVGSVEEFADELAARTGIVGLRLDINPDDARVKAATITVSELTDHYRQRELKSDTTWKTHSTKVTYEGYYGNGSCLGGEATLSRTFAQERSSFG